MALRSSIESVAQKDDAIAHLETLGSYIDLSQKSFQEICPPVDVNDNFNL
jgi:hypothetical protein